MPEPKGGESLNGVVAETGHDQSRLLDKRDVHALRTWRLIDLAMDWPSWLCLSRSRLVSSCSEALKDRIQTGDDGCIQSCSAGCTAIEEVE
jgi:hypothetical protein